jgi:hypothetical protein
MTRPPTPRTAPPPAPEVGERVTFYFKVSGEAKLRSRSATIKQFWSGSDRTLAELDVDFTPEEVALWQFSRSQLHAHMTTHPISGSWTRLPVANG